MPSYIRMCHQGLDENLQLKPCPCRYSHLCPDSTLDCKFGSKWCRSCFTDDDGVFHHTPNVTASGEYIPVNTYSANFLCCSFCMHSVKHKVYSTALGEYVPFEETVEDLPF